MANYGTELRVGSTEATNSYFNDSVFVKGTSENICQSYESSPYCSKDETDQASRKHQGNVKVTYEICRKKTCWDFKRY